MKDYWIPGINSLATHGRWAFAELTDVWAMQEEFAGKVQEAFEEMLAVHG